MKKFIYIGDWKLEKTNFVRYQITRPQGWITSQFSYSFSFQIVPLHKKAHSLAAGRQTPLAECPAKNASLFYVLPYRVQLFDWLVGCSLLSGTAATLTK